jgi:hypothetical protein
MSVANDAVSVVEDRDYWLERAEHHLGLGEEARDSRASWAHFQLAGRYLDRAYGGQPYGVPETRDGPITILQ